MTAFSLGACFFIKILEINFDMFVISCSRSRWGKFIAKVDLTHFGPWKWKNEKVNVKTYHMCKLCRTQHSGPGHLNVFFFQRPKFHKPTFHETVKVALRTDHRSCSGTSQLIEIPFLCLLGPWKGGARSREVTILKVRSRLPIIKSARSPLYQRASRVQIIIVIVSLDGAKRYMWVCEI